MNNALLTDPTVDLSVEETGVDLVRMRERESRLVKLIEALGGLSKNKEWSTLREELFDGDLESLERKQAAEANKLEVSLPNLYRLQGQMIQAKRWDLDSLAAQYQAELANIRKQLNPSAPGV